MKKVILSALVVCAMSMSSVAFAQECKKEDCKQQDKKEMIQKRQDKMAQELNLTEEQKQQMKASKEAMRNAVDAARQKHQADMDKILTPEQKAKMKEMRKQAPEKREMRRHRGIHKMGADSMRPCPEMKDRCIERKGQCPEMRGKCVQKPDTCCVKKVCDKKK